MTKVENGDNHEQTILGSVELIVGPAYSGKTEEMVIQLRRASYANFTIQVFFKADRDGSHPDNMIESHSGNKFDATRVETTKQLIELLNADTTLVAIDDVHLFDEGIVPFVQKLADNNIRTIIAGRNTDINRKPIGPMPVLMAQAEKKKRSPAVCMVCGEDAHYTQRLTGITEDDHDEARCHNHHEVIEKPQTNIKVKKHE